MDREGGSSLPLLVLGVVIIGGMAVLLGRLGAAATDRAQAVSAADAAALAGAAEGEASARELARANGGQVLKFERKGSDAVVTVEWGTAKALGRARRIGSDAERVPGSDPAMAPAMRAAIGRGGQLLGRPVPVSKVVTPGLAVDVRPDTAEALGAVAGQAGLCRPSPQEEPNRFQLCAPEG